MSIYYGVNFAMKEVIRTRYHVYLENYRQYLKLRGYGEHIHDWFFVKRGFITCWIEPGFHRFWQMWNPGIGHLTFQLYLILGGKQRRKLATLVTFILNGLIHNLIASTFLGRWCFPLPFTFFALGVFTIISRWIDRQMNMEAWPKISHLVINIGLIIVSFDFGFYMSDLLAT